MLWLTSAYIQQLQLEGYSIFVVRGAFPEPLTDLAARGGRWLDRRAVVEDRGRSQKYRRPETSEDLELKQALALSMQTMAAKQPYPVTAQAPVAVGQAGGVAAEDEGDEDEEDEELAAALAVSTRYVVRVHTSTIHAPFPTDRVLW